MAAHIALPWIHRVPTVGGRPTLDYPLDASLMRPRYLIRLFETARRRAVTLGREKIDDSDYKNGVEELGWQVLEDFDRELADIVQDAKDLLFELALLGERTSLAELRQIIQKKVGKEALVEPVIDILIWAGCIGVLTESGTVYISDCGFKRPYIRALIRPQSQYLSVQNDTISRSDTSRLRRLQGVGPRSGHALTAKCPRSFLSQPSRYPLLEGRRRRSARSRGAEGLCPSRIPKTAQRSASGVLDHR
jgi:hypothetical protein